MKNGYRPVACVGEGGFCEVWCAVHKKSRQLFAIKAIRLDQEESKRSRAVAMMRAEADFLRRFNETRIVRMMDVGGSEESSHLVLEYISGENIYIYSEMSGLNGRQRIELFVKIVEAVSLLHSTGVIHGDIKPSNFLMKDGNTPVLIDLGMASDAQQAGDSIHAPRFMPGTRRYMAPEQLEGQITRATFTTDVYALCMTASDLLEADATATPIPKRVLAVIKRGMSIDPSHRPDNAGQLLSDLKRATNETPRLLALTGPRITAFALVCLLCSLLVGYAFMAPTNEPSSSGDQPNQLSQHPRWHQEASLLHGGELESAGQLLSQAQPFERNWAWRHLDHWAATGTKPENDVQLAEYVTPLARASSDASIAVYLDERQVLWTVTADGVRETVGPVEQTPRSIAIANQGDEIFLVDSDLSLIHYQWVDGQWQSDEMRGPGQISAARLCETESEQQLYLTLAGEAACQVLSRGSSGEEFEASTPIKCNRVLRGGLASDIGVRTRVGENDYIQVWHGRDISMQAELSDGPPPVSYVYDPDSGVLLTGNARGEVWRYSDGKWNQFFTIPGKRGILEMELNREEGLLFVASHDVYVFDLASGKMLLQLSDHSAESTLDLAWNEMTQQLTAITTARMRTWSGAIDAPSR